MATDTTIRSVEDAMWAAHQINSVPGREETTVTWALTGLQAHGHTTEAAWAYGSPRWAEGRTPAAQQSANRRALPVWRTLTTLSFPALSDELERGQAVILTLQIVRAAWRQPGGVIDAEPGCKAPGNHAVVAVGALADEEQIIIKNSWGPGWGDAGYGFITRRYLDQYGLRAHVLEST